MHCFHQIQIHPNNRQITLLLCTFAHRKSVTLNPSSTAYFFHVNKKLVNKNPDFSLLTYTLRPKEKIWTILGILKLVCVLFWCSYWTLLQCVLNVNSNKCYFKHTLVQINVITFQNFYWNRSILPSKRQHIKCDINNIVILSTLFCIYSIKQTICIIQR